MRQRFGFPSDFDIFFEYARPLHVHRDDREFVAPIDWGQMEKDRQEQIDNAYRYVMGSIQQKKYSWDKWETLAKATEIILPIILKVALVLVGGGAGVFALNYFKVISIF